MPTPFQMVAIADFSVGLFTARDKLIAPKQTWRELVNVRLVNGRLVVRSGYSLLTVLHHRHLETLGSTSGLTSISGSLAETPVHPGESSPSSYKVTFWDGGGATPSGQIVTDDGVGALVGDVASPGSITYASGAFAFTLAAPAANDLQVRYEFTPGLPVTGLYSFLQTNGLEWFVATDTRRFFTWNASERRFYDRTAALTAAGTDVFSGADDDLFWFETFANYLLMVNNVDVVSRFDAASGVLDELPTEFDSGSGGNDLDTCLVIIRHRGRILVLNTTENGSEKPQRARRSNVNDPAAWTSSEFADVPSNDHVLSAFALNDDIVVFLGNGETWVHRYTGDVRLGEFRAPYEWVKLDPFQGAEATHAVFELRGAVGVLSEHGVIITDGRTVEEADAVIPDFHESIEFGQAKRIHAFTCKVFDEAWISYPASGGTAPNEILAFNYRENAFSKYTLATRYLGEFRDATVLTHDTATTYTFDSAPGSYDAAIGGAGFPKIVFGDGAGQIFVMDDSLTDAGAQISARMRTQVINPYPDALALLGWVDVVCDAYAGASLTVKFYKDSEASSYFQETISLTPSRASDEKVRRRIRVNQRALWHQFELEVVGAAGLGIDAFVMAMKPDGAVREIS